MAQVTAAAPYHTTQHGTVSSLGHATSAMVTSGGSRNLSLPSGAISSAAMTIGDPYATGNTMATTPATSPRAGSGYETSTSYEQSRRHVSSVVLSEELLGPMPENLGVKYVEVPVVEEVVRHVPRRTVVEVEKPVPKFEVEYVERIVEIPEVHFVDRHVDKVQVQEVVRTVPIKQVQEVPREVVRTVPKIAYVQVEKVIEVGQTVEVPKPYVVEQRVDVKRYVDTETPVVVAQTIRPLITEGVEVVDVDVVEYEPQVIPVDVHVAKPIPAQLLAMGATSEMHQMVAVPAAQYNTLLQTLNPHLGGGSDMEALPYFRENNGSVPFLAAGEAIRAVQPPPNTVIHPAGTVGPAQMGAGLVMPPPSSGTISRYGMHMQQQQPPAYEGITNSAGTFSHPAVAHMNAAPPSGVAASGRASMFPRSDAGPLMSTGTTIPYTHYGQLPHQHIHENSTSASIRTMQPPTHIVRGSRSVAGATGTATELKSVKSERSGTKHPEPAGGAGKASGASPESAARKSVGSRASVHQGVPVASASAVHKKKACQC